MSNVKTNHLKHLKGLQNKRYLEKKKMQESKIGQIHKSLVDTMMFQIDFYLNGGDIEPLVSHIKEIKNEELLGMKQDDVEIYASKIKEGLEESRRSGKNLKSYQVTTNEIKLAEEKVAEAIKNRDQLIANKKVLAAGLSEKAMKVITQAYGDLQVQHAVNKRKELEKVCHDEELTGERTACVQTQEHEENVDATGISGLMSNIFSTKRQKSDNN